MEDKAEIIISTHSSFRKAAFYGMLYSPVIFLRYLQSHGYLKKVYSSEFVSFCCTYGYLIEVKKISKKVQPAFLIIANDHYYEPRAVFRMAQILQIKTVYVQHASVSENFPPLEYDYVFLDGQESLDKYTANDKKCNSVVFLTGSSRFDMIKTLNMNNIGKNDTVVKVGIAINLVDSTKKIEQFIYKLHTHTPQLQITIRPHPRMGISYWEQVVKKYNITGH